MGNFSQNMMLYSMLIQLSHHLQFEFYSHRHNSKCLVYVYKVYEWKGDEVWVVDTLPFSAVFAALSTQRVGEWKDRKIKKIITTVQQCS